jgi:outer membrane protein TolC
MALAAQSALIGVSQAALYPSIALVGTVGLTMLCLGLIVGYAVGVGLMRVVR